MDQLLCLFIEFLAGLAGTARPLSRLGIGQFAAWEPGEKVRILLAGYNGARNTGADARVSAITDQIKEVFGEQAEITVMTLDKATMEGCFDPDVKLLEFSSLYPLDLYRACTSHHAVVLCEGSTLKSTFANALTLFMCEAAGVMAAQNKPAIAYGAEIGEMEPFLKKAAVKLCKDAYFITRTAQSQEKLEALGLTGHMGTDTAWTYSRAIDPPTADKMLRDAGWDGKKPLLGIAVIDPFCWPVRASLGRLIRSAVTGNHEGQYDKWYYFSDSPARRAAFDRYLREIAAAAGQFLKEQDAFPVLLGMERLDEQACRRLRSCLREQGIGEDAMFLSGQYGANVMTGILHRLDILLTSRYHAAVLSMQDPCPIVAVSMDERLDNLMQELGLDSRDREGACLFHTGDAELGREVQEALTGAWTDRGRIAQHLETCRARYIRKLSDMGTFMKKYLQEGLQNNLQDG